MLQFQSCFWNQYFYHFVWLSWKSWTYHTSLPCMISLPIPKLFICADWTHSQFFCCSFPCEHWDADPCSVPLESCRHIAGIRYISYNCKNSHHRHSCQGISLQQQNLTSCKFSHGLLFLQKISQVIKCLTVWFMFMYRSECLWHR